MKESGALSRKPVILGPGEGRSYPMGRIAAIFKADESESESRYSISEWWLEPHTQGPGAHSHPEDDIFYVIEGTMSVLVGEAWTHATRGSFILVPGGVTHDFENRGTHEPECSTCRYRVRSSRTCLKSHSGLPKIHPKMQASNRAMQPLAGR
jgi:mannose-6-phosphate isomerase-like protein (cupin superfamily)